MSDIEAELADRYEIPNTDVRLFVTGKVLRDRAIALNMSHASMSELLVALKGEIIVAARRKVGRRDLEPDGSVVVSSADGLT